MDSLKVIIIGGWIMNKGMSLLKMFVVGLFVLGAFTGVSISQTDNADEMKQQILQDIAQYMQDPDPQTKTNILNSINEYQQMVSTPSPPGGFQLLVSDAPADIEDFQHLNVTFSQARVFKVGSNGHMNGYNHGYGHQNGTGNSGFEILPLDTSKSYDLTQLVGANASEMLNTTLEAGKYNKIELYVDSVEATLNDSEGTNANVSIPGGKLQITKPFTVESGENITFVFDINVVQKGHSNDYNLRPVIGQSGVVGEHLKKNEVNIDDKGDNGKGKDDNPGNGKGKDKDKGNKNKNKDDVPGLNK